MFNNKPIATEEQLDLLGRNHNFERANKIENMKTWFVVSLWFAAISCVVSLTFFSCGLAGIFFYYKFYNIESPEVTSLFYEYFKTVGVLIVGALVKDTIKKRLEN